LPIVPDPITDICCIFLDYLLSCEGIHLPARLKTMEIEMFYIEQ
jgi:hypothetical protein